MDPASLELIAPMVIGIVLTLTVGGVILLRPIASKLGNLLEAMAKERTEPRIGEELERMRELLETMNGRLSLLEERQDFTDALLADPERRYPRLKSPKSSAPQDPPEAV